MWKLGDVVIMEEIIITSLEKLRCISSVLSGQKQQIIQLEKLVSDLRKDIIKLKEVKQC